MVFKKWGFSHDGDEHINLVINWGCIHFYFSLAYPFPWYIAWIEGQKFRIARMPDYRKYEL